MAPRIAHLKSLKSADIRLVCDSPTVDFIAGSSFNLPLRLSNAGAQPVSWSPVNPLHVSYRWIDDSGEAVERDGLRTSIPAPPAPGAEISMTLGGRTPERLGHYRLRTSLVLEGVHWACDVDEDGWTDIEVKLLARPEWPTELTQSAGGRALRGAIARTALDRSLKGYLPIPKLVSASRSTVDQTVDEPSPVPDAVAPKVSRASKFRSWVRRTLGIQNVQRDLERVANAVTRQEQRSAELHQYLERLEIMLNEGLSGIREDFEDLAGPLRKEHIFNRLTALEVNRSLAAIQDELQTRSINARHPSSAHEVASDRRQTSAKPDDAEHRPTA